MVRGERSDVTCLGIVMPLAYTIVRFKKKVSPEYSSTFASVRAHAMTSKTKQYSLFSFPQLALVTSVRELDDPRYL